MSGQISTHQRPVAYQKRLWPDLYLGVIFAAICLSGHRALGPRIRWAVAEWLINYQGGFIRRGLTGEILLRLGRGLHVSPALLAVLVAIALYAVLLACVRSLVRPVDWRWWHLLLFVSPITVQFFIVSVAAYHKELIYFAGYAVLLVWLLRIKRSGSRADWQLSLFLTVFGVFASLSHEPFAIYAPYIAPALYIAIPDFRRLARIIVLPVIAVGLAMAAVITHPGTATQAQAICSSLVAQSPDICSVGPIQYLGYSKQDARTDVLDSESRFGYAVQYPLLTAIAAVPFIAACLFFWSNPVTRRPLIAILAALGVSFVLSIPLFRFATDWGRWINMHCLTLFLLIFFLSGQPEVQAAVAPAPAKPMRGWLPIVALLYATCWSIPAYAATPRYGYLSMGSRFVPRIEKLLHIPQHHPSSE